VGATATAHRAVPHSREQPIALQQKLRSMFSSFSRIGKTKLRIQYDIEIIELKMGLDNGTRMRIRWKRGSSTENRTMDREANGNVVSFHDSMTIICTLWYDADDGVFLEKESTLQVIEVQPNTENTIKRGSVTFPLHQHCCYGEVVECKPIELSVTGGSISLVVSSRCLDQLGAESDEFSGSDQSQLNEYPFPWDEQADWELNAPIHGEMEQLQAQMTCLKSDQGQQLQDMHAEMLSLDQQLQEKTKQERQLAKKIKEGETKLQKLEMENKLLREDLGDQTGTDSFNRAQEEDLYAQIDELQRCLSMSQSEKQVMEVSCADLHEAVTSLEEASSDARAEKARADKLEKENRKLAATVKMLQSELDGK